MIPYVLLLFVLGIGVLSDVVNLNARSRNVVSCFVVAFCVFFCGFRYYTGSDWVMYMEAYEKMPVAGNFHKWEMGFVWLSLLFERTGLDYHYMQASVSAFVLLSVYVTAKRYSELPMMVFSAFILLLFNEIVMAQVRQSLAIAILIIGLRFVIEKRFVLWCVAILIASQFHVSSVVAFPIYFLRFRMRGYVALSVMGVAWLLTFFPSIIPNAIGLLLPILPNRLAFIASEYLNSGFFSGKTFSNTGLLYIGKQALVVITVVAASLCSSETGDKKRSLLVNCMVIAAVISSLSQCFMVLSRLESYYYSVGVFALPTLALFRIKGVKESVTRLLVVMTLFVFISVPLLRSVTDTTKNQLTGRERRYGLVPYNNYFFHASDAEKKKDWDQK